MGQALGRTDLKDTDHVCVWQGQCEGMQQNISLSGQFRKNFHEKRFVRVSSRNPCSQLFLHINLNFFLCFPMFIKKLFLGHLIYTG